MDETRRGFLGVAMTAAGDRDARASRPRPNARDQQCRRTSRAREVA